MKKRFIVVLAIVLYFFIAPAQRGVYAKDTWVSVRSNNFFLVGNASEKEIRQVAVRLEQFRNVFSIVSKNELYLFGTYHRRRIQERQLLQAF